jgi:hypothetical protein
LADRLHEAHWITPKRGYGLFCGVPITRTLKSWRVVTSERKRSRFPAVMWITPPTISSAMRHPPVDR